MLSSTCVLVEIIVIIYLYTYMFPNQQSNTAAYLYTEHVGSARIPRTAKSTEMVGAGAIEPCFTNQAAVLETVLFVEVVLRRGVWSTS